MYWFCLQIFKAPFAVLLDRERRTVVIAIRGTMSLSVGALRPIACIHSGTLGLPPTATSSSLHKLLDLDPCTVRSANLAN